MALRCSKKIVSSIIKNNCNQPLFSNRANLNVIQVAFIAHKDHIDREIVENKPKPWPYETKKYTYLHEKLLLDKTIARFDENTKVITIDGTIASGKKEFGKKLAEELGMKYYPQPDIDDLYVDHTGFDHCTLNKLLPECAQFVNMKMLHANPHHSAVNALQFWWYKFRVFIYFDALAHLYSTGQGVILDRNPWSDIVFVEAMWKHGYYNSSFRDFYYRMRNIIGYEIQRPHVCIYLDITPEESLKRIKARNSVDANSKYVNLEFLKTLDDAYKHVYLPQIADHAELLVYDWKTPGDVDVVVEDLERLDFDQYELKGSKMRDWRLFEEENWNQRRRFYANKKGDFYSEFILPVYDVDGLEMNDEAATLYLQVMNTYPPNKYLPNYDPSKNSWLKLAFKIADNYRDVQNRNWYFIDKV